MVNVARLRQRVVEGGDMTTEVADAIDRIADIASALADDTGVDVSDDIRAIVGNPVKAAAWLFATMVASVGDDEWVAGLHQHAFAMRRYSPAAKG